MKNLGNIQRMCMASWLLAALLVGGMNIYQLMMVQDQPLVGYSQTIKMLQENLQRFDQTLAEGLFSLASRIELPEPDTGSTSDGTEKIDPPVFGDQEAVKVEASEPMALPSLAGIMHIVGTNGLNYYQALIDGRLCRTKDKIDGFTVVKISPDAVVVRKSGLKWTIESPTPYYSSDQGN